MTKQQALSKARQKSKDNHDGYFAYKNFFGDPGEWDYISEKAYRQSVGIEEDDVIAYFFDGDLVESY